MEQPVDLASLPAETRRALERMVARCPESDALDELPAAWAAPLAKLEGELATIWPDYELRRLRWSYGTLSIDVSWPEPPPDSDELDETYGEAYGEAYELVRHASYASRHWGEAPRPVPVDPRVVVALDIDGVLNVVPHQPLPRFEHEGETYVLIAGMAFRADEFGDGPARPLRGGLMTHEIALVAGAVNNPFFAGSVRDVTISVRVNEEILAWVRDLHARAEVVWATTWEDAANEFARVVGIPQAAVGVSSATHPPRHDGGAATWKGEALADRFANRPLVWVDDQAGDHARNLYWRHPDDVERTLVICCESGVGLEADQCAAIDAFIERWSPAAR